MTVCQWCGQEIKERRSPDISRRYQAWITWMTRELHGQQTRQWVHAMVLLKAIEIMPPPGGHPWPHTIVQKKIDGVLMDIALPDMITSGKTNRQLMCACEACHMRAAEWGIGPLPEKTEKLEEEIE